MSDDDALRGTSNLSPRELQLLVLAADGLEIKETAVQLGTSRQTVKNQLLSAYRKLGARNRTHAIAIAFRTGVIPLNGGDQ